MLQVIVSDFTYVFVSLFSILNPIGMSTVFLAMTKEYPSEKRHKMAWQVAMYGAILLIVTFFIGQSVLKFFGISLPCIQVAGGLLVFFAAWGMLDVKPKIDSKEEQEALRNSDISFFPLTMPITAGAGALAVTMTIAGRYTEHNKLYFLNSVTTVIAILSVFIVVGVCYRYADGIFNRLGYTGTNVVTRLTAFILLSIGVSIIWKGIQGLILSM